MGRRRPAFAAFAALLALAPCQAPAQALSTTDLSIAALGTGVVQCVPPDTRRRTLYLENAGTTNTIAYCVAVPNSTCTPSANAAGSSTLSPATATSQGGTAWWPSGSAPIGPLFCVAGGSSSPVTIRSEQ
jgi:hypothetical protein